MILNHETQTGAETSISAKLALKKLLPSGFEKANGINPILPLSKDISAPASDEKAGAFSWFDSVKDTTPTDTCTLQEIVDIIRSGQYRSAVEQIRAETDKDKRNGLKKKLLPAVSFSVAMSTRAGNVSVESRNYRHTGLLQLDIDAKDNPTVTMAEIRELLKSDPHVVMICASPSGALKAVCRIPCDVPAHKAAFEAALSHYTKIGIQIDKATSDVTRLCFLTHDPEAWLRPEPALILPVIAPEPTLKTSAAPLPLRPASGGGLVIRGNQHNLTHAEVQTMLAVIPPRPDYLEWLRICSAVWNTIGQEEGTAALQEWSPEESPGEYAAKYPQRLTDVKAGTLVMKAQENGWINPRSLVVNLRAKEITETPPVVNLICYDSSDAGNAERVNAVAKGNIHFVTDTGQWLLWNGCRWFPDRDGQMTRLFLQVMETTVQQATRMPHHKTGEEVAKYALGCRNLAKVTAGLAMLKSVVGVSISAAALDANPWVIGTPNGLIDLRVGHAIDPDKSHFVTKSIGCDYDPAAACPLWEEFISTVTGGDPELPRYLQAVVGYALTAEVREQCLFFFYGLGENGKGVFTETIKSLLGNYAMTAPESMFTNDRNSSATNDIARLVGCRLATASELDEGASFAESRLKSLTGGDTITARFLHREFFDFQPTHKFWISGNHKPYVRGADHGIWRRLRLIPFTVKIPAEKKDPRLAEKLRAELPGILRWALEGSLIWQNEGLVTPQCVIDATADYRAQEDLVGQFMEDRILIAEGERALQSSVYQSYQDWALGMGIAKPWSAAALNRKLSERGIAKTKINGARFWRGIITV